MGLVAIAFPLGFAAGIATYRAIQYRQRQAPREPDAEPAPAYMIIQGKVTDRAGFMEYVKALPPLYGRYHGRYLAMKRPQSSRLLEGNDAYSSTILTQWRSLDDALDFWNSPEYTELKKLREGKGEFDIMLLEGMPPANSGPPGPPGPPQA